MGPRARGPGARSQTQGGAGSGNTTATTSPTAGIHDADSPHVKFLIRSLSRCDLELSVLNRLNRELQSLRLSLLDPDEELLLEMGEGRIRLSHDDMVVVVFEDENDENRIDNTQNKASSTITAPPPVPAPTTTTASEAATTSNTNVEMEGALENDPSIEETKSSRVEETSEAVAPQISKEGSTEDAGPILQTRSGSVLSAHQRQLCLDFLLRMKLRRRLLNRLIRRLQRISAAMDGENVQPPFPPKYGDLRLTLPSTETLEKYEQHEQGVSEAIQRLRLEGIIGRPILPPVTQQETLRRDPETQPMDLETPADKDSDADSDEVANEGGASVPEGDDEKGEASAEDGNEGEKASETLKKENLDDQEENREDKGGGDGDEQKKKNGDEKDDDQEEDKELEIGASPDEATSGTAPVSTLFAVASSHDDMHEQNQQPDTTESIESIARGDHHAQASIERKFLLDNEEIRNDVSQIMEYDVGYDKLVSASSTRYALSDELEDKSSPDDEGDGNAREEDYMAIKYGAGVGATHRTMSTREKEAEWYRWQNDILAAIPDQPTFEELGMDNRVFFLEARQKRLRDSKMKKTEDENAEEKSEEEAEKKEGNENDEKQDTTKDGEEENEGEDEEFSVGDADEPSSKKMKTENDEKNEVDDDEEEDKTEQGKNDMEQDEKEKGVKKEGNVKGDTQEEETVKAEENEDNDENEDREDKKGAEEKKEKMDETEHEETEKEEKPDGNDKDDMEVDDEVEEKPAMKESTAEEDSEKEEGELDEEDEEEGEIVAEKVEEGEVEEEVEAKAMVVDDEDEDDDRDMWGTDDEDEDEDVNVKEKGESEDEKEEGEVDEDEEVPAGPMRGKVLVKKKSAADDEEDEDDLEDGEVADDEEEEDNDDAKGDSQDVDEERRQNLLKGKTFKNKVADDDDGDEGDKEEVEAQRGTGEGKANDEEADLEQKEDNGGEGIKEPSAELPPPSPKKVRPLSLQPVPSFFEQDLRRIRNIHADLLSVSVHEDARLRIAESVKEYNQAFHTSMECSNRSLQIQAELNKLLYQHKMEATKIKEKHDAQASTAYSSWAKRREEYEAKRRAVLELERRKRLYQRNLPPPRNLALAEPDTRGVVKRLLQSMVDSVVIKMSTLPNNVAIGTPMSNAAARSTGLTAVLGNTIGHMADAVVLRAESGWIDDKDARISDGFDDFHAPTLSDTMKSIVDPGTGENMAQRHERLEAKLKKESLAASSRLQAAEDERRKAWKKMVKIKADFETVTVRGGPGAGGKKTAVDAASQLQSMPMPPLRGPQGFVAQPLSENLPLLTAVPATPGAVAAAAVAAAAVPAPAPIPKAPQSPALPTTPASTSKYSAEAIKARIETDGSVRPVTMPKKNKDGLFMRPAGRRRKGMEWDPVYGKWTPTTEPSNNDDNWE